MPHSIAMKKRVRRIAMKKMKMTKKMVRKRKRKRKDLPKRSSILWTLIIVCYYAIASHCSKAGVQL